MFGTLFRFEGIGFHRAGIGRLSFSVGRSWCFVRVSGWYRRSRSVARRLFARRIRLRPHARRFPVRLRRRIWGGGHWLVRSACGQRRLADVPSPCKQAGRQAGKQVAFAAAGEGDVVHNQFLRNTEHPPCVRARLRSSSAAAPSRAITWKRPPGLQRFHLSAFWF